MWVLRQHIMALSHCQKGHFHLWPQKCIYHLCNCVSIYVIFLSCKGNKRFIAQFLWLLPAATKLWPRQYFYTCLSFCSQGGFYLSACWDTTPPWADTPLWSRPPGSRPPQADTPPPEQTPPWEQTPPRADPLQSRPPQSRHPPKSRHPPGKQTPPYNLRAAGTHPTGMHSCFLHMLDLEYKWCYIPLIFCFSVLFICFRKL